MGLMFVYRNRQKTRQYTIYYRIRGLYVRTKCVDTANGVIFSNFRYAFRTVDLKQNKMIKHDLLDIWTASVDSVYVAIFFRIY